MADNDDTTSTSEVDTGESSASDEDEDLQLDPLTEIILQLTADYESIKSNNQNIRKLAAAAEEEKRLREMDDSLLAGIAELFREADDEEETDDEEEVDDEEED